MKTTNQKLQQLREEMKKAQVQAYLVLSSDPHMSEYLPEHWNCRSYLSGFDGSAGTLVVTETESGLWTDGRYFIQAEKQISDSEIQLFRMKEKDVPTYTEYLTKQLKSGQTLGIDGTVTSVKIVKELEKAFAEKQIQIKAVNLIDDIWEERPAIPSSPVYVLDETRTGCSTTKKLEQVRAKLAEEKADAMMISRLDSIAWLLNLRGNDIECNTFFISYCFIAKDYAIVFSDSSRFSPQAIDYLNQHHVQIQPYQEVVHSIESIADKTTILCDDENTNYNLYLAMKENQNISITEGKDPIQLLKAVKNPVEIENTKQAHIKEGISMVRLQIWLEQQLAAGNTLNEVQVGNRLTEFRKEQEGYLGDSFDFICAYGANAAMMHYHPTPENHAVLQKKGFLLLDTGGQYLDGTTDTTRTYALGELTKQERLYYTYVLKAHMALARVVFMQGCTGGNLDIMSRNEVWKYGIDYRCGTGHGVGFVGGVHEGPQSMHTSSTVPLEIGMNLTDEPGIYEEGLVGIRIENELSVVQKIETKYGVFLGFEPFTYCPIDTTPIVLELFNEDDFNWLNQYHQLVYDRLSPGLTQAECEWLKDKTKPLTR